MELTGFDVRAFLAEDVGDGDVTAEAVVPADARLDATLLLKEDGVVCGLEVAEAVFRELDPDVRFEPLARDGDRVQGEVARVSGNARALLTGERTALNLLGRLSGIATLTRRYVDAVAGTRTLVLDTRKTTPGLRALEKLAVRAGGGTNHRFGLYDAVLIKDNHLRLGGGVAASVRSAKETGLPVEVECETLDDVREALDSRRRHDPARQHDAGAASRSRRTRRRPREDRSVRRHHARNDPGGRRDRRRCDLRRRADAQRPLSRRIHGGSMTTAELTRMHDEVKALARERGAVILAHNYQVPEVQDVADYVGDSLGLSRQAAATGEDAIVFCGVHFMAETAKILSPEKTVLIPDPDAGCSLAVVDHRRRAARVEGGEPGRGRRLVREHDRRGEGRDRLLLHVRQREGRHRGDPARSGDLVLARHVPRPLAREGDRPQAQHLARRVPRARGHPARRTSSAGRPRRPTPSCSCIPSAAARRRRWRSATSARTSCRPRG